MDAGVAPADRDYRRVRRAWGGMGRHYHTLAHLDACLREFDSARELALRPGEVELALWFHDAIYRSWRRDNEKQSAALADRTLRTAAVETAERVRQMVLATTHSEEGFAGDTALVMDVDLAILGRPPEIYAQFERAIRREYWWAPRARYVAGRTRVLRGPAEPRGYLPSRPLLRKIRAAGARQHRGRDPTAHVEMIAGHCGRYV